MTEVGSFEAEQKVENKGWSEIYRLGASALKDVFGSLDGG